MSTPLRFFVIGDPIAHSLSPKIHGAAFAELGLPHTYETLRVQPHELESVVRRVRPGGDVAGLNVTVPHKLAVLPFCDVLADEVRLVSAANTLYLDERDRLVADNTDVEGFRADLVAHDVRPRRALVLGTGGAARAVVCALVRLGAKTAVAGRSLDKARDLVASLQMGEAARWEDLRAEDGGAFDLIVNATSAGMAGGPPGEDVVAAFRRAPKATDVVVYDTVYRAPDGGVDTALVREARSMGSRALDGTGMLVEQGARALERFLRHDVPGSVRAAMHRALLQALGVSTATRRDPG